MRSDDLLRSRADGARRSSSRITVKAVSAINSAANTATTGAIDWPYNHFAATTHRLGGMFFRADMVTHDAVDAAISVCWPRYL